MNAVTLDRIFELARTRGEHLVSVYLPTRPFAPGSQEEDTTRLKNLLRDAAAQLEVRGLRSPEIEALLAPARALTADKAFWLRSGEGLALLLGTDGLDTFQLPAPVTEQVWIADHYYLRPLLPFARADEGDFWLLALNQKHVRLYRGTSAEMTEVSAEEIPESLAEAMRYDDFEKESLQFHTNQPGAVGGGQAGAVFHGNGEVEIKDELSRFFNAIDRALKEHLHDSEAPLVLAGVNYVLPLYRSANTYPHLLEEAIPGSVERVGVSELHARVRAILDARAAASQSRLAEEIKNALGSTRLTADPETIVSAAHTGRIDTLLLAGPVDWWGSYDAATTKVILHKARTNGDDELLGLAALRTLENGGAVLEVTPAQMPHGEAALALLRY